MRVHTGPLRGSKPEIESRHRITLPCFLRRLGFPFALERHILGHAETGLGLVKVVLSGLFGRGLGGNLRLGGSVGAGRRRGRAGILRHKPRQFRNQIIGVLTRRGRVVLCIGHRAVPRKSFALTCP